MSKNISYKTADTYTIKEECLCVNQLQLIPFTGNVELYDKGISIKQVGFLHLQITCKLRALRLSQVLGKVTSRLSEIDKVFSHFLS